jgi:hypothetical protein
MRIVHHIPGRLRVRVPAAIDGPALTEVLERLPGVHGCAWSERTRGLLVRYEPEPSTAETVLDALNEHGMVDAPPPSPDDPAFADPRSPLARAVTDGFGQLDDRVRRATRGVVGLGGLIPVALTLWAVRELALGRGAPLAWSSALWYAHGLFRDYNSPSPR